jgi:hypothetical protein
MYLTSSFAAICELNYLHCFLHNLYFIVQVSVLVLLVSLDDDMSGYVRHLRLFREERPHLL